MSEVETWDLSEMTQIEAISQAQADIIMQEHNNIFGGTAKDVNQSIRNANEGIKNLVNIQQISQKDEENEAKRADFNAEMEQKKAELEFKQQQAEEELEFKKEQSEKELKQREKELDFRKDQAEKELEFKKQQAEDEKKAKFWDILSKIGIAIIPVLISSIFTVIVVKITCSENRKTLMATMLANEILERAGEISNVTAKDVAKEALKQATNVKIK